MTRGRSGLAVTTGNVATRPRIRRVRALELEVRVCILQVVAVAVLAPWGCHVSAPCRLRDFGAFAGVFAMLVPMAVVERAAVCLLHHLAKE
jgi:hypothetical protein